MAGPFRVAILTVSDTSSSHPSTDVTGPLLSSLFTSNPSVYSVVSTAIVPDSISSVQAALSSFETLSPAPVQLCITTGGTGFALRDMTPEAVSPLLVRQAPGLVHAMMATSLTKTPMAALSRPVAGVTEKGMLVVTVPGSPKGAKENVECLLQVLPHALDLLSGGTGKKVHKEMGMPKRTEGGSSSSTSVAETSSHSHGCGRDHGHSHSHSHSHGHHHHGPTPRTMRSMDVSKGASARHRHSPYPIIPLSEAFDTIFENTPSPTIVTLPVTPSLIGHIIAEDVFSASDLPQTRTTNVDGYAIRAASTPAGVYPVFTNATYPTGSDGSGSILTVPLPEGHIYRINTGGPLPLGADAVIMVEDTEVHSTLDGSDSGEEKEIRLLASVDAGENVRSPGSDVKQGEKVLEKGARVSEVGGEIGTLAFVGRREVQVYRKPKVAVMSTGNEITELHQQPESSSAGSSSALPVIYDSNRPSLHAALASAGFEVVDLGIVPDDQEATHAALQKGMVEHACDVIITTGGTSMGESDLLKPVIERRLNGTVRFGRVAMKPGKPTTFATIPTPASSSQPEAQKETLVFALPGNPASALVTYHLFVLPCLRKLSGYAPDSWHLPKLRVRTTTPMRLDPRPEFHRVWIEHTLPDREQGGGGELVGRSTGGQRSSRTVSLRGANGLVCLPSSEGKESKEVKEGEWVDALLIGSLE